MTHAGIDPRIRHPDCRQGAPGDSAGQQVGIWPPPGERQAAASRVGPNPVGGTPGYGGRHPHRVQVKMTTPQAWCL